MEFVDVVDDRGVVKLTSELGKCPKRATAVVGLREGIEQISLYLFGGAWIGWQRDLQHRGEH
jgi:hypothetical protein